MAAFDLVLRVMIFLAIVIPTMVWLVRRARKAHDLPESDASRAGHREGEAMRSQLPPGGWSGGTH